MASNQVSRCPSSGHASNHCATQRNAALETRAHRSKEHLRNGQNHLPQCPSRVWLVLNRMCRLSLDERLIGDFPQHRNSAAETEPTDRKSTFEMIKITFDSVPFGSGWCCIASIDFTTMATPSSVFRSNEVRHWDCDCADRQNVIEMNRTTFWNIPVDSGWSCINELDSGTTNTRLCISYTTKHRAGSST